MSRHSLLLIALTAGPLLGPASVCTAQAPAVVTATPLGAGGGAVRGKRLFIRCSACHGISDSAVARIGPNLQGVIGRKAGTLPGYRYSSAMQAAEIVWDEATLDRWLADPAALVPGTAMAFAGLGSADERRAIIAYLANPQP